MYVFPQMDLESVPFCLVVFVVQFGFPICLGSWATRFPP